MDWNETDLNELHVSLANAGYTTEVDLYSAPLVLTLFRDVLRGAKYGKTAYNALLAKEQKLEELQNKIKEYENLSSDLKQNDIKHRTFRLLRLASTSIYILTNTLNLKETNEMNNNSKHVWGSVSTSLLAFLLNAEKTGVENATVQYWKILEERDLYIEEVKEKDSLISDILSDKSHEKIDEYTNNKIISELELKLLSEIEIIKNKIDTAFCLDEAKYGTEPLLQLVDNMQKQIDGLYNENMILKEKSKNNTDENFIKRIEASTETINESIGHDNNTDKEIEAELAKYKQISREKQKEIRNLKKVNSKLEFDLSNLYNNFDSLQNDNAKLKVEYNAVSNRCDLFQEEFDKYDIEKQEIEQEIKKLKATIEEYKSKLLNYDIINEQLEQAQLTFIQVDKQLNDNLEELNAIKIKNVSLESINQTNEKAAAKIKKELEKKNAEIQKLMASLNENKNLAIEANLTLTKANAELESLHNEITELQNENKLLENELSKVQEAANVFALEKDAAETNYMLAKSENEKAEENIKELIQIQSNLHKRLRIVINYVVSYLHGKLSLSDITLSLSSMLENLNSEDFASFDDDDVKNELVTLQMENSLLADKLDILGNVLNKAIHARTEILEQYKSISQQYSKQKLKNQELLRQFNILKISTDGTKNTTNNIEHFNSNYVSYAPITSEVGKQQNDNDYFATSNRTNDDKLTNIVLEENINNNINHIVYSKLQNKKKLRSKIIKYTDDDDDDDDDKINQLDFQYSLNGSKQVMNYDLRNKSKSVDVKLNDSEEISDYQIRSENKYQRKVKLKEIFSSDLSSDTSSDIDIKKTKKSSTYSQKFDDLIDKNIYVNDRSMSNSKHDDNNEHHSNSSPSNYEFDTVYNTNSDSSDEIVNKEIHNHKLQNQYKNKLNKKNDYVIDDYSIDEAELINNLNGRYIANILQKKTLMKKTIEANKYYTKKPLPTVEQYNFPNSDKMQNSTFFSDNKVKEQYNSDDTEEDNDESFDDYVNILPLTQDYIDTMSKNNNSMLNVNNISFGRSKTRFSQHSMKNKYKFDNLQTKFSNSNLIYNDIYSDSISSSLNDIMISEKKYNTVKTNDLYDVENNDLYSINNNTSNYSLSSEENKYSNNLAIKNKELNNNKSKDSLITASNGIKNKQPYKKYSNNYMHDSNKFLDQFDKLNETVKDMLKYNFAS